MRIAQLALLAALGIPVAPAAGVETSCTALRLCQCALTEAQALEGTAPRDNGLDSLGYGVASVHLVNGSTARACALLRDFVDTPTWQAFGANAAEAELVRGACRTS